MAGSDAADSIDDLSLDDEEELDSVLTANVIRECARTCFCCFNGEHVVTINISWLKLKWALVLGSILQTMMIGLCGTWVAEAAKDKPVYKDLTIPVTISAIHTVY